MDVWKNVEVSIREAKRTDKNSMTANVLNGHRKLEPFFIVQLRTREREREGTQKIYTMSITPHYHHVRRFNQNDVDNSQEDCEGEYPINIYIAISANMEQNGFPSIIFG
jgi:hypothetical protein